MAAAFLERFQKWILNADPGTEFRASLKKSLQESFGKDGTYGVFVRSDTNVEDLPGFTGAGLNLTVANVVGYDNILKAIHDVWASPFDERSYGWRQSHMQDPEYVFPAVVIQLAFASAKSGVMVTKDIEDDEPGWVTVAISEGVGGAVEGQATESVRIDTKTGQTQFLAQATAAERTELNPAGGVKHVPASGTDEVLKPAETAQLITLAKKVRNLDSLRGEDGEMMPADIEFGFKDGKLGLLQIRPFVESQSALSNPYLTKIDGAQGNKKSRLRSAQEHSESGPMTYRSLKRLLSTLVAGALLSATHAGAYPLDGYQETDIARLDAYWLARNVIIEQKILPKGIFWPSEDIKMRLFDNSKYTLPAPDAALSAKIRKMLGPDANSYGIALLDYTDPEHPIYAAVNPNKEQNPGSVGKIAVMLAWFQALADVYPDDIDARIRLLRDTPITADAFVENDSHVVDSHVVPIWKQGDPKVLRRPIEIGEVANVWTYLDWMVSASANAAASMMMKNLILLTHFGKEYPPSQAAADAFFAKTSKSQLARMFTNTMQSALRKNDLDPGKFRQGKFFTREAKRRVPVATNSVATARELLRFIMLMEEGRLVDPWSSLEMKKTPLPHGRSHPLRGEPCIG